MPNLVFSQTGNIDASFGGPIYRELLAQAMHGVRIQRQYREHAALT